MDLFTWENLVTLCMLVFLQAVLGFDNLLYISIESKRVAEDRQAYVRKLGIGIAIGLRIVLLLVVIKAVAYLDTDWFILPYKGFLEGAFDFHSIILLVGGVFIIYTAMKEIFHMMAIEDIEEQKEK
ncbi:MAG: hypothetical protein N2C12_15135, partial [Planctomycetales bacterium]